MSRPEVHGGLALRLPTSTGVIAFFIACSLTGCGPPAGDRSDHAVAPELEDTQQVRPEPTDGVKASAWSIQSGVDPLTDIGFTVAIRTFRTGAFSVELQVSCDDRQYVTYTAATFDQNGDGAPLDWSFGSGGLQYRIEARVDREEARSWYADKRRYSNQFELSEPGKLFARGNELTLRFPLERADATIFIDQTDHDFRDAVAPCLEDRTLEAAHEASEPSGTTAGGVNTPPAPATTVTEPIDVNSAQEGPR